MNVKRCLCAVGLTAVAFVVLADIPGLTGTGARYATDVYPGFDREEEIVAAKKKEPRWFACINGPNRDTAKEQFEYCESLMLEGSWSKAAKHLDALVREWPVSPEASRAQQRLAEIELEQLDDPEESFAAYRYLIDFYSTRCDYRAIVDKMYKVAKLMRERGKNIVFFHFDNTIDVRRAFEACVLRAPGASWVREAMLTIAALREDEGKYTEAVKVYENLRNLYAGTPEAREAFYREACARMVILGDMPYNRNRRRDTIDFFRLALLNCEIDKIDAIKDLLAEASSFGEEEAYRAAKFYDSPTRTVRSAITAYERFLEDYPESEYAEKVRTRLNEINGAK